MNTTVSETQFRQLVQQHKATIYGVCYMFSDDADVVSDLFQESLINIWQGLSSFNGKSSLKTWLWRVTLNTCLSAQRKKRLKTVPLDLNINLFEDRDPATVQVNLLKRRISRLRPFDRAIVLLWLESMSYEEIALIAGITVKQVSMRLFRIKEQLKRMSNPETDDEDDYNNAQ